MALLLEPFLRLAAEQGDRGLPALAQEREVVSALGRYLDLLLVWNARTNLSAIREPEEIVRRHFGESLFAALCLRRYLSPDDTILDLGSGAGFPGLPLSLLLPSIRVTLVESQNKKAAFLREAARVTGSSAVVLGVRSEELPDARCDGVTLRAVDRMGKALAEARRLVEPGGTILWFGGRPDATQQFFWRGLPDRSESGVLIELVPPQ